LTSTAAFLSDLANVFDLSIVIINQMTTKIGGGVSNHDSNSSSSMNNNNISGSVTPALGESWAHSTTTRLLLMFDHDSSSSTATQENGEYHLQNQRRICKLVKSPHKAAGTASFRVTEFGLRDVIH
jgi:RecA/RadA recombinase